MLSTWKQLFLTCAKSPHSKRKCRTVNGASQPTHSGQYIDPSCTSIPYGWNKSTSKTVHHRGFRDMNIRQDDRMVNESKPPINSEKKILYDPRRAYQQFVSPNSVFNLFIEIRAKKQLSNIQVSPQITINV